MLPRALGAFLFAAALVSLAGCGTSAFDGPLADLVSHDLGPMDPLDQAAIGWSSGRSAQKEANDPRLDISGASTVEDFVQFALLRNPSIRSAAQRVDRFRERIAQVKSLDDPIVSIAPAGDMAETAAGQVSAMTSVSQRLPFPGKLSARGRIASQDVAIAQQDLHAVTLSTVADTRRAYWSLYYTVRAIETTRGSRTLLAQFNEVIRAKYRAGVDTQESVLRASVELSNLDNELITLDQQRSTAAAMLNSLIDRPIDAPLADPAPITLRAFDASLDGLLAVAVQSNPTLQRVREQIQRFREERQLAHLGRFPDLNVSFTYNLVDDGGLSAVSTGDNQWWVGLGFNVPIWKKRLDAAEREATRGILESAGKLAATRNRIAFDVQDALVNVQTQRRLAILFRDVIVPQARQTVEASLSGYRAGDTDFLTLIDNWRKLLDFQLLFERSLADLEKTLASLEQTVGVDLNPDGSPRSATHATNADQTSNQTSNQKQGAPASKEISK